MAAIVVSLGVIVWIVAGLGGPDDFLDTLVNVANGRGALIDVISVVVPALLVEAAALIFLLRGVRFGAPRRPTYGGRTDKTEPSTEGTVYAPPLPPTQRQDSEAQKQDDEAKKKGALPTGAGRVFAGVFLFIWLIGWSTGIVFAFGALMSEWASSGPSFFLIIWLTFAIIGWFFAVTFLFRIIRGR